MAMGKRHGGKRADDEYLRCRIIRNSYRQADGALILPHGRLGHPASNDGTGRSAMDRRRGLRSSALGLAGRRSQASCSARVFQ